MNHFKQATLLLADFNKKNVGVAEEDVRVGLNVSLLKLFEASVATGFPVKSKKWAVLFMDSSTLLPKANLKAKLNTIHEELRMVKTNKLEALAIRLLDRIFHSADAYEDALFYYLLAKKSNDWVTKHDGYFEGRFSHGLEKRAESARGLRYIFENMPQLVFREATKEELLNGALKALRVETLPILANAAWFLESAFLTDHGDTCANLMKMIKGCTRQQVVATLDKETLITLSDRLAKAILAKQELHVHLEYIYLQYEIFGVFGDFQQVGYGKEWKDDVSEKNSLFTGILDQLKAGVHALPVEKQTDFLVRLCITAEICVRLNWNVIWTQFPTVSVEVFMKRLVDGKVCNLVGGRQVMPTFIFNVTRVTSSPLALELFVVAWNERRILSDLEEKTWVALVPKPKTSVYIEKYKKFLSHYLHFLLPTEFEAYAQLQGGWSWEMCTPLPPHVKHILKTMDETPEPDHGALLRFCRGECPELTVSPQTIDTLLRLNVEFALHDLPGHRKINLNLFTAALAQIQLLDNVSVVSLLKQYIGRTQLRNVLHVLVTGPWLSTRLEMNKEAFQAHRSVVQTILANYRETFACIPIVKVLNYLANGLTPPDTLEDIKAALKSCSLVPILTGFEEKKQRTLPLTFRGQTYHIFEGLLALADSHFLRLLDIFLKIAPRFDGGQERCALMTALPWLANLEESLKKMALVTVSRAQYIANLLAKELKAYEPKDDYRSTLETVYAQARKSAQPGAAGSAFNALESAYENLANVKFVNDGMLPLTQNNLAALKSILSWLPQSLSKKMDPRVARLDAYFHHSEAANPANSTTLSLHQIGKEIKELLTLAKTLESLNNKHGTPVLTDAEYQLAVDRYESDLHEALSPSQGPTGMNYASQIESISNSDAAAANSWMAVRHIARLQAQQSDFLANNPPLPASKPVYPVRLKQDNAVAMQKVIEKMSGSEFFSS